MINEHINYKYDRDADAISIKIEDFVHEESIQLNNNLIMDLNKEKQFIGLEILSASHALKTTKLSLENIANIALYLKVTDYEIFVNAIFTLPTSNHEEIKVTNATILNKTNIPKLDINLVTA